ncbi:prepilin cleavage protein [Paraglaciecola sp. 20A4]|uniref:prepilin cleavage protein n=1 Tax=Paraglaciecola sp. 20A4 TaxID=2687288 RepID=UPI001F10F091|nr:prepilin cleavage protein [Paraglaciecola sp. 20A4]
MCSSWRNAGVCAMLKMRINQLGSSLLELMIAMSLGVSALTAFSAFIGFGLGMDANLLTSSRLNEEFTVVSHLMARDIARAGYNGHASLQITAPVAAAHPFANSLLVGRYSDEIAQSCILFAYDRNANGVLDTQNSNENYGYRLRDKAIEMRMAGAGCDEGGWHDLTDPNVVEVTRLYFTINPLALGERVLTQIEINIIANLKNQPEVSRQSTLKFTVNNHAQ